MSLTSLQLEERLNYICGSDSAVICGVSKWGNIIELWQEKIRQRIPKDISDNPHVKAGNFLESAVREWFEHETNLSVKLDGNLLKHPTIPYIAGNIDGRIGDDAIFEAKTSSSELGWGEQGENKIPDHYLLQVSHYMLVTDTKRAYVAVLIRGSDFRHYVIERNMKLEGMMIKKYEKFWNAVKTEIAPDASTGQEVLSLYGYESIQEPVIANGDMQEDIDKLEQLRVTIKESEDMKKKIEDKIKIYMGQKDTLLSTSGKIVATWKQTRETSRFDASAFKKENEQLYKKYTKACSSQRRFVIKQLNEGL
jgi:putative phage-type endonuclease